MSPEEAVNLYMEDRHDELSKTTRRKYGYQLNAFTKWCDEKGVNNLNELTGRKLQEFKDWRGEQVKPLTLKNNLWTVKSLVQFCEHIDSVPEGVHRKVRLPKIDQSDEVKENAFHVDNAKEVLEHLAKFEYASLRHALFLTLWKTGIRMGTLQALDVDDFEPDRNTLKLRHRPKTGTPLKNKQRAERNITIGDGLCGVINDYIEQNHPMVEDENGRIALFMGKDARAFKTTVQRNIYTATRPCHYTNECPHGRGIDDCVATSYNTASQCPSSCGPHALRKGYVTAALDAEQPADVTAERTDMSREVLDKHYDQRDNEQKRTARERHLKDI